jgi:hypothetical protein
MMLSVYASPHCGILQMNDEEWAKYQAQHPGCSEHERFAYVAFEYGKNASGYWTAVDLILQTERAIDIFESSFPFARAVFYFDNSANHAAFAPDALVATHLNVRPGGAQPKLRDGWFMKDGVKVTQPMQDAKGEPKGLKQILLERGLLSKKQKMKKEVMIELLQAQPDFSAQKSLLQEWIERRGHAVCFLPKFHPEVSLIEMVWSAWKRNLRRTCDGTFESLREQVHIALQAIGLEEIRAYERHCQRYINAYRQGLDGYEAAQKIYKSHRRIAANADEKALKAKNDANSANVLLVNQR